MFYGWNYTKSNNIVFKKNYEVVYGMMVQRRGGEIIPWHLENTIWFWFIAFRKKRINQTTNIVFANPKVYTQCSEKNS